MSSQKFDKQRQGKNTLANFKNLKPNECKQIKGGNGDGGGTSSPEEEEIDKKI